MKNIRQLFVSFFVFAVSSLTLLSCQETLPVVNNPLSYAGNTYSDIFEGFWSGMNTNYVFWDIDTTNWDNVYRKYKPMFSALGEVNTANNATAEQYFTEMTANLVDSHYTITFPLTGHQISPALNRKVAIDKIYPDSIYSLPATFFTSIVRDKYLNPATVLSGTDTVTAEGSKIPLTMITGRLSSDNTILYFHTSAFFFSLAGANTGKVLNSFFNTVSNSSSSLKGIIIDIRENGGGETDDVNSLVGALSTNIYTYGFTHSKSGVGRLDFTPDVPAVMGPQSGSFNSVDFNKPVAVLVDHLSVSAAEITALAVRQLPGGKGKIVGTTTWGANGPLLPSVYLNGGQFTIGTPSFGNNGYMFVYTSSESFKDSKGISYEGRGIPPDIHVIETSSAYNSGVDLQLQAAVKYVQGK
jgi:carboxyl-terminal processing protease